MGLAQLRTCPHKFARDSLRFTACAEPTVVHVRPILFQKALEHDNMLFRTIMFRAEILGSEIWGILFINSMHFGYPRRGHAWARSLQPRPRRGHPAIFLHIPATWRLRYCAAGCAAVLC